MIFSRQKMDTAFNCAAVYYDKILFVDLVNDSFQPIKVNSLEWNKLEYKEISFTDWVADFVCGEKYAPCNDKNKDQLVDLLSLDRILERKSVFICNYFKEIDGNYHIVQLELYPLGDGTAFLFVRDLTKMQQGIVPESEE